METKLKNKYEKISHLRKLEDSELFVVMAVLKVGEETQSHYLTENSNLTNELIKAVYFDTQAQADSFVKSVSINYELVVSPLNYFIDFEIQKYLKN